MTEQINPVRDGIIAAVLCLLMALVFCAAPARAAGSPDALIFDIYTRAQGTAGGDFIYAQPKDRPKYLSKSLVALWAKAEALAEEGYAGPIEFDPITNSQDPRVYGFGVKVERQDETRATVSAIFAERPGSYLAAPKQTIYFDLVREDGAWKIDDIRGQARSRPVEWSLRKLLADFKG